MAHVNCSWARVPHATLEETSGITWLHSWLLAAVKNRVDFIIPVLFSLGALTSSLCRRTFRDSSWVWLLVPSPPPVLVSVVPPFRFGEAPIWVNAAWLGALALQQILPITSFREKRVGVFILVAIAVWCNYLRTIWRNSFRPYLRCGATANTESENRGVWFGIRVVQVPVETPRLQGLSTNDLE
jgi:hypothetical protein